MREKWDKNKEEAKYSNGQQMPAMYKSKLLLKRSPSSRAIDNYNNLSLIENTYDNLCFIPEDDVNNYASSTMKTSENSKSLKSNYDYASSFWGSSSMRSTASFSGSELESDINDKYYATGLPWYRWCLLYLEPVFCTIALAAGFGNIYRLPQAVQIHGGLPFLVAYIILTILLGFPLLFLELGIGQLTQEGFIKSSTAVPFFQGVGYVKLIAGCLVSIYYPLYMGLSAYYVIWLAKGSVPFTECAIVKIKETGYSADGIDGQQCLRKMFLESPSTDHFWFGIFIAILFGIWVIITFLPIRKTKGFIISLVVLLTAFLACMIALIVKAVSVEDESETLENFIEKNVDWSILQSAEVWYYAAIQVLFSTGVGFGTFVTNAGITYSKVNPLRTALGYIIANLLFGVGFVFIFYILTGKTDLKLKHEDVPELHLISVIYTTLIQSEDSNTEKYWAIVAYAVILISGFISMITVVYTLLQTIILPRYFSLKGQKLWNTIIGAATLAFVLGGVLLYCPHFQLVHLLDHYIVGNIVLITVVIEVFALIAFYGTDRIKSDFEFVSGHLLSKFWLVLWWCLPVFLTAIFAWGLSTLHLEGVFETDPEWLYATGWGIVLTTFIFIFAIGMVTVSRQDGYTFCGKFGASLKPPQDWGPRDPMSRHKWVQWNSKAEKGERDFTLKRQGTRDYTRTVKKNAKKAASDLTLTRKTEANTPKSSNASSNDYIEPYYRNEEENDDKTAPGSLQVTHLMDSLNSPTNHTKIYIGMSNSYDPNGYKTNLNPLTRKVIDLQQDGSNNSGEYGTFNKGPYIIPESEHVCHKRFSEDATEL